MSERVLFWDVDTQHDFVHPEGALYVPGAEDIGDRLSRLTRFAEAHRIPIVASADDHRMTDDEISTEPDFSETFPPHCMHDTAGAERTEATDLDWTLIVGGDRLGSERIEAAASAEWPRLLILKDQLDAFSNPNTGPIVDALAPDRIVVYGVALDFCVRCAIDSLLDHGAGRVTLLTDATRAIASEEEQALLERWRAAGVELAETDRVLDELSRTEPAISRSTETRVGSSSP